MATCTLQNVGCTSNVQSCNSNEIGSSVSATGAIGAPTSYTSPVTSGEFLDDADINKINSNVMAEVTRRRILNTYTDNPLATQNETKADFPTVMQKIKTNLSRLNIALSTVQYDKLNKSTIDTIYSSLNTSAANCTCNTRCACNNRAADCPARCVSYNTTWGACTCNGDCTCNVRDSHASTCYADATQCACNLRCPCNARAAA